VRGGSVFGVGEGEIDREALGRVTEGSSDRVWDVVGAVARGLSYAGVLLAAGGAAFLVLVHRGGPEERELRRIVTVAAVVGGVTALVALPVQAALGTGKGAGALFDEGVLDNVLEDGLGLSLALTIVGLVVLVVSLTRWAPLALLGAAVAAGSFAAAGHTRAGSTATLATLTDVSHLWVTALWSGGLVLLWRTIRAHRGDPKRAETVRAVGRFSTLATIAVVLVGVTGSVLAWTELRSFDALTGTTYGRLLIVKVVLVAWVAALGAYNHFRLVPALTRGGVRTAMRQLFVTVRLEVVSIVVVVALTAVLVVATPGRSSAGGLVEEDVPLGDVGSVQLTIDPARAGTNQVHLYLLDPNGQPAELAESITMVLSLPEADLGPITREAVRAGPAHFQLDGSDFAIAGTWNVDIRARIDRFTEEVGSTEIPIAP
jgi:copper transport protein